MPNPRLAQQANYLAAADHSTRHAGFWTVWDAIAGDLVDLAWLQKADSASREAFTDLLALADDAGWAVPDGQTQQ